MPSNYVYISALNLFVKIHWKQKKKKTNLIRLSFCISIVLFYLSNLCWCPFRCLCFIFRCSCSNFVRNLTTVSNCLCGCVIFLFLHSSFDFLLIQTLVSFFFFILYYSTVIICKIVSLFSFSYSCFLLVSFSSWIFSKEIFISFRLFL